MLKCKLHMYQVSVIVPVYNTGKNLVRNINSLLDQELKSIEIIIVNDASSDDTASVINSLASKYTNIKPIHLPVNKGVHEARLEGIKHSSAPWIGFMDADDFVRPKMFNKMIKAAKSKDADIVVCGVERVDSDRKFLSKNLVFKNNKLVDKDVFKRFCRFEFGTGMLCNKIYKRELVININNLHFPWRQDINEDLIVNIGCFSKARKVFLLKDVLYDYVLNEESRTENINRTDAFIEHFRAFALAINAYAKLDDNMAVRVSEIYRMQLANYSYPLDNLSCLVKDKQRIKEAVELLQQSNPLALGLIATSPRPAAVGRKEMLKYIIKSSLVNIAEKLSIK